MAVTPCAVPGCTTPPIECWGTRLCLPHGEAAAKKLAADGLDFASWQERCAVVARWLEAARKRAEETKP